MTDITNRDYALHIPRGWPKAWPIRRGDHWLCPRCAEGDVHVKLHGKTCPKCYYRPPAWALDFRDAYRVALKLAKDGEYDLVDGCFHCSNPTAVPRLAVCTTCNRETCYTHEVDVLKFFVDPNADLSKVPLEPELLERLK